MAKQTNDLPEAANHFNQVFSKEGFFNGEQIPRKRIEKFTAAMFEFQ